VKKARGFDEFELDTDEYDMYRMSMLMDNKSGMPKAIKEQAHRKINQRLEERTYQEQMARAQEKQILEEFAAAYGYDPAKH
jgi:hypothetical protein